MSYDEEQEDYDPDMFEEFGEGFEDELGDDNLNEKIYEQAFDEASADAANLTATAIEEENDFEFDEVVGGRDKKPVMSLLNKGKLSRYEMDDLLNQME